MKYQAILFTLSIDVSILIAATGCSGPLQSIESCHGEARPFERTDSGNPLAAAYVHSIGKRNTRQPGLTCKSSPGGPTGRLPGNHCVQAGNPLHRIRL